jgi:hypothetical protein
MDRPVNALPEVAADRWFVFDLPRHVLGKSERVEVGVARSSLSWKLEPNHGMVEGGNIYHPSVREKIRKRHVARLRWLVEVPCRDQEAVAPNAARPDCETPKAVMPDLEDIAWHRLEAQLSWRFGG